MNTQPTTNGQQTNNKEGDEDGQVMNNLMSDIQNGFVHRRLPDGGFKVLFNNTMQIAPISLCLLIAIALEPTPAHGGQNFPFLAH